MPGRVIFLNGTSSAGKTTLARAIQDESPTPWVYWGIDTLFSLVPPNWGGGRDTPRSRQGFWYDRRARDRVVIRYGPTGHRMLRSAMKAATQFAHGGDDLVIDEMLLAPELMADWHTALTGLDLLLVRVTCPAEVAQERERPRRTPDGLSLGHLTTVHAHPQPYDLTIDTTTGTPPELAREVLRHQAARP